ncbi:type II secretion system F family protein [Streptacidiphilus anmyonensis]|uniref:type II secretion system F family protein n=1 Tax=Streptacidiphilus anmyonensis TaxID=405782 RepID=UPI0005A87971|nr:type II secretion system F family protein [Streptacidiphilus anmyonensis]
MESIAALCAAVAVAGLVVAVAAFAGWATPENARRRGHAERRLRALAGFDGGQARAAWWRTRRTRVLAGGGVAVAVWLVTGWPMAGLLSGLVAGNVVWLLNPGREHAMRIARLEGLEEWVRRLADIHTTGLSLEQSIRSSAPKVPAAIEPQAKLLVGRLAAGWPTRAAYRAFGDDLDDVTADMVVAMMLLHVQDRGGGLSRAFKELASCVQEEVLMRRKVEADRAKPRANMRWIVLFCLVVFALSMFSGSYVGPYSSPLGVLAMVGFALGFAAMVAWMRSMANMRPTPRFLSSADRTKSLAERTTEVQP